MRLRKRVNEGRRGREEREEKQKGGGRVNQRGMEWEGGGGERERGREG